MKNVKLYDIEWDIDNDDSETDLPASVIVDMDNSGIGDLSEEELEEYGFADWLSDKYGFCVRTFLWKYV